MGGDGGTSSHQSSSLAPVTCPPSSSSSPPPPPPPDAEIASDPPKDLGFAEPIPDAISSSSSSKPVLSDDLRNKIVHQVEYYFSDENLPKDKFLLKYVKKDKGFGDHEETVWMILPQMTVAQRTAVGGLLS